MQTEICYIDYRILDSTRLLTFSIIIQLP